MRKRDAAVIWHLVLSIADLARELRRMLFGKKGPPAKKESPEWVTWYCLHFIEYSAEQIRKDLFPEQAKP